jgi:NTP pyrophosphatase (non-canonical NTP hydrolase)
MKASQYQEAVERTMCPFESREMTPLELGMLNYSMGMAGEGGEAADLVKKHVFHGHDLDRGKLLKECGDVVWYACALAAHLGVDFSDVLQMNIEKLQKRYPEGFNSADSVARRDIAATPEAT